MNRPNDQSPQQAPGSASLRQPPQRPQLKRSLSLPLLTLYGLGSIVGAGIYALVGEVAGYAGYQAPFAFLMAALIAAFSGLSYAELAARFPKSAGEAVYVHQAFGRRWLTAATGWAVVLTGIVSAGTIANAFSGYLGIFVDCPRVWAILLFVMLAGLIAAWGIAESVCLAAIMTGISIAGLLVVLLVSGEAWAQLPERWPQMLPRDTSAWMGVTLGAFLAFYAFIGFEDMVNVAEEVIQPRRTMPLAIILALSLATVLYCAVAMLAVLALPLPALVGSSAPLADILASDGRLSPKLIALASLVALTNSALAQVIMAARVAYGLAQQRLAPRLFGRLGHRSRTPVAATFAITLLVLILALWLPMHTLAELTSLIILLIFSLINVALLVIRIRLGRAPDSVNFPLLVPICGALLGLGFVLLRLLWQP